MNNNAEANYVKGHYNRKRRIKCYKCNRYGHKADEYGYKSNYKENHKNKNYRYHKNKKDEEDTYKYIDFAIEYDNYEEYKKISNLKPTILSVHRGVNKPENNRDNKDYLKLFNFYIIFNFSI
ncbi:hypothetical protein BCR32DRAFT_249001 [Anaeromyces robustus]|uniref:Uncharacterized protein n=1 Tax=Anaeromyces robustus TaxID=1754192 RepID=A0A1Y1WSA0_9FUNG|nr:hypothetical protein BCR32DRAFT_249001 [Anaeromyces robustus]|eukprot:ORX76126.1 hypothetical protein BCR32DRAFT_249001 [Anaeromyces robustus]